MARPSSPHHGRGAKLVALLCSTLLACTTVRTHVSAIAPEVTLREGNAVVQLDLWVESNRPLALEEELRYRADARSALEQAVAGRALQEGTGALVIRSVGVTRTGGRRGDQTAAAVGIAVGIVAIVVVAIVAMASEKGGGGGKSVKAPRSGFTGGAPGVSAPAPRLPGVRPPPVRPPRFATRPVPRPGLPRGVRPGRPIPHVHRGPAVDVGVGVEFWIPIGPEPLAPPPPALPPPGAEVSPPDEEAPAPDVEAQAPEQDAGEEPAAAPRTVALAPPEPIAVDSRGFFDGDRLVLDAVMVDPATGEVLWRKRVEKKADPRNASAVRKAVDELLSDGGWTAEDAPGT